MGSSSGIQRPDLGHVLTASEQRAAANAKRPIGSAATRSSFEKLWSQATLSVTDSGRYYPPIATRLLNVLVSLDPAGTSNTVLAVKMNGSALADTTGATTITLGSGVHMVNPSYFKAMTADLDYLTFSVTTIGSGAANLVVQARFG